MVSITPPSAFLDLSMNTCRYTTGLNRASPESEYRQETSMAPGPIDGDYDMVHRFNPSGNGNAGDAKEQAIGKLLVVNVIPLRRDEAGEHKESPEI